MARFFASTLRGCAAALAVALAAGAQNNDAGDELQFTSGPLVLDGQSNMMRAQQPRITQGNLRIAADDALATGFEFEQAGEFRLTGNVRVNVETASMEANSAVFTFANGQLSHGELEGTPVSFSDVDAATQRKVTGHAGRMSYDNVARTLRMTGDASVQLDTREVLGCDLIYDFRAERVTSGSADCEGGFRVRVRRDSEERTAAPVPPQ
ncbi:MAG TPA: LptA/OstA family protein [Gammaproteobacteria bacterium]|nr:LptA/OstA family protein [Gammaproteobacteria bacterium]